METSRAGRDDPALGGGSPDDDMAGGDLGDGMGARAPRAAEDPLDLPPQAGICRQVGGGAAFSESDRRWSETGSGGSTSESSEVLWRRLQEVTEEAEVLRTELEVTRRHLEGKHEALRILQGQAILDRATSHTKILLQKSEERTRVLEKEANALQWEMTFDRVRFKNVEQTWELKYDRAGTENAALRKALDERLEQLQDVRRENSSLSQQCLELLGLLSFQERRDFQKTRPPPGTGGEGSALELAVYGACQCSSGGEPCPCARSAAASRNQVLQLQQELELQTRRKDEAYVMVDAFRIAFEQQLRRGSEKVLRLAEGEPPRATPRQPNPDGGKLRSSGVAQRLRRFLPSGKDGDALSDTKGTLQLLLDLLSDKEEALAHQRKVSYMLARSSEELEKRLQAQTKAERAGPPACPSCDHPGPATEGVDRQEATSTTPVDGDHAK